MDSLTDTAAIEVAAAWFSEAAGAVATGSGGPDAQPTMVERSASCGQMPPLLRRDEDEAYRVVEGEVTFFIDGYGVEARAGDVVVALAGVTRTFRVESRTARWTVLTRVADLQRFVDFGRAVSAPRESSPPQWPCESELAAVAALGAANGIELLGPPGALPD